MEILLFNKRSAGILHESSDICSFMLCHASYVLVLFRASRPPSATPALLEGETAPLVQLFYTRYLCPSKPPPHPGVSVYRKVPMSVQIFLVISLRYLSEQSRVYLINIAIPQ